MSIQPVILAGGTGSRLWPLSRELYPKQVISLTGELSLLQTTVQRVVALEDAVAPVVVVGEEHRFLTKTQLEELGLFGDFRILLEPMGKNTAPAICGAASYILQQGRGDDVLLVLPADHLITKTEAFLICVSGSARFENENGETHDLKSGDCVLIEPMVKHWVDGIETSQLVLLK